MKITVIALCLFSVSFFLPTIDDGKQQVGLARHNPAKNPIGGRWQQILPGWEVFCAVIKNLPFSGQFLPAWFANWIFLFGFVTRRPSRARGAAWISVFLALSAAAVAINSTSHWLTILYGYYVWLGSMVLILVGVEIASSKNKSTADPSPSTVADPSLSLQRPMPATTATPQTIENSDRTRPGKRRRILWLLTVLGLVSLIAAVVAVRDWNGRKNEQIAKERIASERLAKEAEALVDDYLRDLARPDVFREENAKEELERLKFVSTYGAYTRLSGEGFVRPKYFGMLIERLEMKRTIEMTNGDTTITIIVTGTPDGAIHVQHFYGGQIWVLHPAFR
jgi:hypothetical protein